MSHAKAKGARSPRMSAPFFQTETIFGMAAILTLQPQPLAPPRVHFASLPLQLLDTGDAQARGPQVEGYYHVDSAVDFELSVDPGDKLKVFADETGNIVLLVVLR